MTSLKNLSIFVFAAALVVTSCAVKPHYANRAERLLAELKDPTSEYVFVMAHRADWRNWPENSLEAIESAIQMGCDILELDVAMTRDSQLVLSHDLTLDRMTNGHGRISDYTLAELKELRLRQPHGVVTENLRIATLKEALKLCEGRALCISLIWHVIAMQNICQISQSKNECMYDCLHESLEI